MKKKKFVIVGLGEFGFKLVKELAKRDFEVIALDREKERVEKVKDIVAEAMILDSTDKEVLEKSGIKEADVVILSMGGNIESSILALTALKEIGVKEIIARAINPLHAHILKNLGANRVIFPEEDAAERLALSVSFPGVRDYLKLKGPWDVVEIEIGPESKFKGKTIKEIHPRSKYHVSILMIEREKEKPREEGKEPELMRVKEFPRDDFVISEKDILVVFGEAKNLENFEKHLC